MNETQASSGPFSEEEKKEYWVSLFNDWRNSGLTMTEFLKDHPSITRDKFMYYRNKYTPDEVSRREPTSSPTNWTSISLDVAPTQLNVFVQDVRIEIPSGFDQTLLKEIVEVLRDDS